MFLFYWVLLYSTTQRKFGKKSLLKLPGIFQHVYGGAPSVSSYQNSNLIPGAIFKKYLFHLPLCDKMRCRRGWPKQKYILFIIKNQNFTEKDFSKDFTNSSKVKYMKMHPDIMMQTSKLHH